MKTNLYIPEKIKVGLQNRSDTYTKKLAYVTYYKGNTLMKETSWQGWRDKNIEPLDFDNEPTEGFVLNKKVGDYSGYYGNHRQAYCRIYDPRGFEFEIKIDNLLYILENATSTKGKGLEGQFVYSWDGKDLVLLPCESPDYQQIKNYTKSVNRKDFASVKQLNVGNVYQDKENNKYVYLGKFNWYTSIRKYASPLQGQIDKGLHHWFVPYSTSEQLEIYKEKDIKLSFLQKKSMSGFIFPEVIDTVDGEYLNRIFEDLTHSCEYSKIDVSKSTLVPFELNEFFQSLLNLCNWDVYELINSKRIPFYIKGHKYVNNNDIEVFSNTKNYYLTRDVGLNYYFYNLPLYSPIELFNEIQPHYYCYYLQNGELYKRENLINRV